MTAAEEVESPLKVRVPVVVIGPPSIGQVVSIWVSVPPAGHVARQSVPIQRLVPDMAVVEAYVEFNCPTKVEEAFEISPLVKVRSPVLPDIDRYVLSES